MATVDRGKLIRAAMQEMQALIEEKNRNRDRIRDLLRRVRADLGIESSEFIIAGRIAQMAAQRKQHTLESVREILMALGQVIPTLVIDNEATKTEAPKRRARKVKT